MSNPDYQSNYYRTSWKRRLTVLLGAAKSRRKHDVKLAVKDLLEILESQDHKCFYTGVPLVLDSASIYESVSLDRLDNSKGYVPENVVLTTWRVNRAKSNMTSDEFIAMCRAVVNHAFKSA